MVDFGFVRFADGYVMLMVFMNVESLFKYRNIFTHNNMKKIDHECDKQKNMTHWNVHEKQLCAKATYEKLIKFPRKDKKNCTCEQ